DVSLPAALDLSAVLSGDRRSQCREPGVAEESRQPGQGGGGDLRGSSQLGDRHPARIGRGGDDVRGSARGRAGEGGQRVPQRLQRAGVVGLWAVGAGHLIPVWVSARTNRFCSTRKTISTGTMETTEAAMVRFAEMAPCSSVKPASASGRV